ncbi:MAG TPA: glycosyltransferase [Bryobacteraceae bacterium]
MESPPVLLFFNNFPPSNKNGGTVLIRRLLDGYPREKLIALTSTLNTVGPIDPPWCRVHREFPSVQDWGSRAIWRLKGLINRLKGIVNWLMLPVVAFYATRMIRRYSVKAIASVSAGTFFLAAAMAARWMNVPWVLIVHDDWVPIVADAVPGPRWFFDFLFRTAVRRADHILVVSVGMQEKLKVEYGVESEVQMPATEPWDLTPPMPAEGQRDVLKILYSGNGWAAMDSLNLLVRIVREQTLRRQGLPDLELHMYAPWSLDPDPSIKQHGWVSEKELRRQIAAADILFLPYSFENEFQAFTRTSFPAKAADYLASGGAILVIGPKDSTTARYVNQYHCAELVTELSEDGLVAALTRLASGEEYCRSLGLKAQQAFALNHDIVRQQERFFELLHHLVNERANRGTPAARTNMRQGKPHQSIPPA